MGELFFGVDIQNVVAESMPSSDLPNFTFVKVTNGTRTPGSLVDGTNPTTANYPCHGSMINFSLSELRDVPMVQKGDQKFVLIGLPLINAGVEPEKDDLVVANGVTYTIVALLFRDAAKAAFHLHCRG